MYILSLLNDFKPFQSVENFEAFYASIEPTNKKVLQLLVALPETNRERDAFKFLQQYIRGLDKLNCGHFLRLITGADILIVSQILCLFIKQMGFIKHLSPTPAAQY